MVKIRCPVCNGTGRVSTNFGNPCPVWYGNTWTTNVTNQQTRTTNCQTTNCQTNWYIPSPSITFLNYPCEKTCPACGGTGLQECDHDCHCCHHHPHHDHCCHEKRKYRVIEKPPCPNPYIPYTSSKGSTVPGSYTITVSMTDSATSKKHSKIDEL